MDYEALKAVANKSYEELKAVNYIYLSEAGRNALTAWSAIDDAFRIEDSLEDVERYLQAYCKALGDVKPDVVSLVKRFIELHL